MLKLVILSCLMAAASAGIIAPLAYSAPFGYYGNYGYAAPYTYSASYLGPSNYRGPLSLAPGQPANIIAADGRPLDTLDVNLDRSAHYTAKALDSGLHLLKKRSVIAPIVAPVLPAPIVPAPVIAAPATPLITPAVPLTYAAPIAPALIAPIAHVL